MLHLPCAVKDIYCDSIILRFFYQVEHLNSLVFMIVILATLLEVVNLRFPHPPYFAETESHCESRPWSRIHSNRVLQPAPRYEDLSEFPCSYIITFRNTLPTHGQSRNWRSHWKGVRKCSSPVYKSIFHAPGRSWWLRWPCICNTAQSKGAPVLASPVLIMLLIHGRLGLIMVSSWFSCLTQVSATHCLCCNALKNV